MDNLAHTLVGAVLGETGLKRRTRLASPTLIIGANLPDIDGLAMFWGRDVSLYFRRGWTHGVLAWVVLPFLLTAAMLLIDKHLVRRRRPELAPANGRWLLLLSVLSVLSHPALDWLNTYGVRLLMPFDSTWFYGDTIFIIDPWLWLSAAAPVVWARSKSIWAMGFWATLGVGTSLIVLSTDLVGAVVKGLWAAGILAIVAGRWLRRDEGGAELPARFVVASLSLYILSMAVGSIWTERQVVQRFQTEMPMESVVATPVPANPFARDVIIVTPDAYQFVYVNAFDAQPFRVSEDILPRRPFSPIAAAALRQPEARGLAAWLRFPVWSVEETQTHWRVTFHDVRRARSRRGNRGGTVIEVAKTQGL